MISDVLNGQYLETRIKEKRELILYKEGEEEFRRIVVNRLPNLYNYKHGTPYKGEVKELFGYLGVGKDVASKYYTEEKKLTLGCKRLPISVVLLLVIALAKDKSEAYVLMEMAGYPILNAKCELDAYIQLLIDNLNMREREDLRKVYDDLQYFFEGVGMPELFP